MKLIRRILATLAMAGIAAIGVRLGGKGGTPRQHGGWVRVDLDSVNDRTPASSATDPTLVPSGARLRGTTREAVASGVATA